MKKGKSTFWGGRCMISGAAISRPSPISGMLRGDYNYPEDLDGSKRKHRLSILILKGKANEQRASLSNVLGQVREDELLDVVKYTSALLNGVEDRCKVIVSQDNIRSLLGDIRTARPMTIPIPDCFKPGESLTPSPVMETKHLR